MIPARDPHTALALELELGRGRRGASARLELVDRIEGPARRVARITLRGWIGRAARRRLERAFLEWVARGVDYVVLDCRAVSHLGSRAAHRLVDAALMLEADSGGVDVCGLPAPLSRRLETSRVRCWPAESSLEHSS